MSEVPDRVSAHVPNVARMYDYYLGGKNNFAADREAAEKVLSVVPELRFGARMSRKLLGRVVRFLAGAGIRQFLDLGPGLPTEDNVHEVALRENPDARVVYVDNDPVVIAHGRAVLEARPDIVMVEADLRRPAEVVKKPEVTAVIDFAEPVAVLLMSIMHFIPDEDDPPGIVAGYRDAVVPGSYIALSHVVTDIRPEAVPTVTEAYRRASSPFIGRTSTEIPPYFDGLELVPPGLVNRPDWRPEPGTAEPQGAQGPFMLVGVGRKPGPAVRDRTDA